MPSRKPITPFESFEGNAKNGTHIRITKDMMRHQVWVQLRPISVKLYLFLKSKYKGRSNGYDFTCTYVEINKATGLCDKSIKSALDDLISKGFIEVIENNRMRKLPNVYRFSDKWQHFGKSEYEYIPALRKAVVHSNNAL